MPQRLSIQLNLHLTQNIPLTIKLHQLDHWTDMDVKLHVSDPLSTYTPTAQPEGTQVTHPFCSKNTLQITDSLSVALDERSV